MNIAWIFNHYALPPDQPGGTRHFYFAKYLQKHNWRSTIIASDVNYFNSKKINDNKSEFTKQIIDGVDFLWIKVPLYKGNGFMRIVNILTYTFKVLSPSYVGKLPAPDLIVGSSVHPFAAVSAYFVSKRLNVPFIFEVRDLWPETLIAYKKIKSTSLTAKILRHLEKFLYLKASKIIVTLPDAHKYIRNLGVNENKVKWISNGVDLDLFSDVVFKLEKTKVFTFLYLGSHGQSNDLGILIEAMKIIEKENNSDIKICLKLVGDGPLKRDLIIRVKSQNISNITFHQPVKKTDIPSFISCADAFVILVPKLSNLYSFGISMNKIFDYLASKRPILIATDLEKNPISEACAGLTVKAGDPNELAKALMSLASMSTCKRNKMAKAGYEYVKHNFGFDILGKEMSLLFNSCLPKK